MTHRIVILGGGTGGTLSANRLRRLFSVDGAEITVVDQDDRHVYQPGLLFVPFGLTHPEDIVRPRRRQLHRGVSYRQSPIERVDIEANQVQLGDGMTLGSDVLVVATGAVLVPEETEGLTGPGWIDRVFTFYTPEGAAAPETALAAFDSGRLVVNVVDMPIKCPVAPLEFCFLADWYFTERGIRDRVQLTYVTPLDGAFTKPVASRRLASMLADKGVELVTEFNTGEVDGAPAASSATTVARSASTWCRGHPPAWRRPLRRDGRPGWATRSTSCPPTYTPSKPRPPRIASAYRVAARRGLTVLEWSVTPAIAAALNSDMGTTFTGLGGPGTFDIGVDRRGQRAAIACHQARPTTTPSWSAASPSRVAVSGYDSGRARQTSTATPP